MSKEAKIFTTVNEAVEYSKKLIQAKIELADVIKDEHQFVIKGRNIESLTMTSIDRVEDLISKINKLEQV